MALTVENLEDQTKFRHIITIPYYDLIPFVFNYLKKKTWLTLSFGAICILSLVIAIRIRLDIATYYPLLKIFLHTGLGLIAFPLICIPVHELFHIIPYYISGARDIRVGMDLSQYLFYVTAHRQVATPLQFKIVAITPFILISVITTLLLLLLPDLWKWSLALFLFVHTTMCAGDFALLNFYVLNPGKKIYTWDDAEVKEANFYEKVE